jgi:hypothetical protein
VHLLEACVLLKTDQHIQDYEDIPVDSPFTEYQLHWEWKLLRQIEESCRKEAVD